MDYPFLPSQDTGERKKNRHHNGQKDKNFETNIHLYTANDEFAVQIQQIMQGLLAIVQLQAGNTDNSMAKEAAKFLKDVKISQKQLVRMSMAIPVATILERPISNSKTEKSISRPIYFGKN